jgi:RimJ/RimL family protein N-acetyltransferase
MPTESIRSRQGLAVRLRPAAPEDCDRVFHWQTEPGARRYSRNPCPPTWEEHSAWFATRLALTDEPFFIIVHGDEDAGFLRLDAKSGGDREVAILVSPAHQGVGVATAALQTAVGSLDGSQRLIAHVNEANVGSWRAFLKAGFTEAGPSCLAWRKRGGRL